jgi:hypothetical protein
VLCQTKPGRHLLEKKGTKEHGKRSRVSVAVAEINGLRRGGRKNERMEG